MALDYCPACWPADACEREGVRCADCGTLTYTATGEHEIALLYEMLGQANHVMGEYRALLIEHGIMTPPTPRPALTLVKGGHHEQ